MSKVSVIMTTYNHKSFISEAIESVIKQRFQDRELLIGDDSPNYETWNIILNYIGKYPEKIHGRHHKKNMGITRNMLFLIGKMDKNSQYCTVLEGDDFLSEEYLETKLNIFKDYDVDLVYNDLYVIDEKSNIIQKNYLKNKGIKMIKGKVSDIDTVIAGESPYHSWSSLMFKRTLLDKISIETHCLCPYNYVSDYDFFIKTLNKGLVFGIEEPLTFYREHTINTSKINNYKLLIDLSNLICYYYEIGLISSQTKKNVVCRLYVGIFLIFLKKSCNLSILYSVYYFFELLLEKIKSYFK